MMEQVKIGITDEMRSILEGRAAAAGHTMSEESRRLLWVGLATTTINPVSLDWAREAALTHAAWRQEAAQ